MMLVGKYDGRERDEVVKVRREEGLKLQSIELEKERRRKKEEILEFSIVGALVYNLQIRLLHVFNLLKHPFKGRGGKNRALNESPNEEQLFKYVLT